MKRFSTGGYTYFGVLFVVMLIALALAGASGIWQVQQQRYKEQQLLYVGKQYTAAIAAYYNSGPGGFKQHPRKIADLLKDPRDPGIKRYLRKPWPDPLNVTGEWGLVRTSQGAIAGIYSRAKGVPLKRAGFGDPALESAFANGKSYAQWKFVYIDGTGGAAVPGQDLSNMEPEKRSD
jgi:type II secretory pathway pseudopilin PulG